MTLHSHATTAKSEPPGRFRLPDPPEREPDEDMTSFKHLAKAGNAYLLAEHLGNPETTLIEADRWIVPDQHFNKARAKRPDMLVAFGVDPAIYEANNGYVVSEQGKGPDFVLEVASESTGDADLKEKRDFYEFVGVVEYWRFDETGEFHGARLAGERLGEDGRYHPIGMEVDTGDEVRGYSAALGLSLRWERGRLGWHDPATGEHIATFDTERDRADSERRGSPPKLGARRRKPASGNWRRNSAGYAATDRWAAAFHSDDVPAHLSAGVVWRHRIIERGHFCCEQQQSSARIINSR